MFSSQLLTFLVYGALIWCAVSSVALLGMLVRDLTQGKTW
jgi:hypothetical protein